MCIIGFFSKYAWVVPLKDKKGATIVDTFQNIANDLQRKPNKVCVDQGSEFYKKSLKKLLDDNVINMYSIYYEGTSVVAERFIKGTLMQI